MLDPSAVIPRMQLSAEGAISQSALAYHCLLDIQAGEAIDFFYSEYYSIENMKAPWFVEKAHSAVPGRTIRVPLARFVAQPAGDD
jgi:hypothetical protein